MCSCDRVVVILSGGMSISTVLIYDVCCWSGFYILFVLYFRSISGLLMGTDFCFFNTVPAFGDFVSLFIIEVGDGVNRSINLLVVVVIVLDVWCMILTYGGMFRICQTLFIHKMVIPIIDRCCFLTISRSVRIFISLIFVILLCV